MHAPCLVRTMMYAPLDAGCLFKLLQSGVRIPYGEQPIALQVRMWVKYAPLANTQQAAEAQTRSEGKRQTV